MGKVTHRCLEGSEEEGKLRAAGGRGVSGQLFDYCHDLASGSATWGKTGRQTGGMWVAFVVRWASEKAEEGGWWGSHRARRDRSSQRTPSG